MKKLIVSLTFISLVACKNDSKNTVIDIRSDQGNISAKNGMAIKDSNNSEWITLFDGTDFDQWRGYGKDSMYDAWSIDGDAMMFTPGDEGGKNIITRDTYRNFVLSLEWKISEGGNSGIFWGVHDSPEFKEAYETGPEIQVLDDERHPDAKVANGTHKAGSLYDMIKPAEGMINPAGEWNSVELSIDHDDNIGKVVLNGKEAYTFPVNGPEWDKMVAKTKFANWKGFGKYPEGHIGLQDHGDKVWYRDIKIKKLE